MSDLVNRALVYRLAIFIAFLFSINSLSMTFVASFTGIDWGALTGTQKFVIICACCGNWTNTLLAFLNKTLSRVEQGKTFIASGDSDPPFPKADGSNVKKD